MTKSITRLVRVPFAGYVDIEVDWEDEPKLSSGWADSTDFEGAVLDAVYESIEVDIKGSDYWDFQFLSRIVSGNVFLAEQNGMELLEDG